MRIITLDFQGKDGSTLEKEGWLECTVERAPSMSAIAYYVSNMLSQKTDRKIGAVVAAQGASAIQSWLPEEVLSRGGRPETKMEVSLDYILYSFNKDGFLYNNMLSRIKPFSFAGAVWYQGESNAWEADIYMELLKRFIGRVREDFKDPSLPFVIVQIADCDERDFKGWHMIQDIQLEAEKEIAFVKTVISRDVSQSDDIHPKSKRVLSERIAAALA